MTGDYHVRYCRSKLHGKSVYYYVYSAIEYVFAEPEADHWADSSDDVNLGGTINESAPDCDLEDNRQASLADEGPGEQMIDLGIALASNGKLKTALEGNQLI